MTENQLKYLAYQETLRHNAATEAQAQRELSERARSNLASEEDTDLARAETVRHNKIADALSTIQTGVKVGESVVKVLGSAVDIAGSLVTAFG